MPVEEFLGEPKLEGPTNVDSEALATLPWVGIFPYSEIESVRIHRAKGGTTRFAVAMKEGNKLCEFMWKRYFGLESWNKVGRTLIDDAAAASSLIPEAAVVRHRWRLRNREPSKPQRNPMFQGRRSEFHLERDLFLGEWVKSEPQYGSRGVVSTALLLSDLQELLPGIIRFVQDTQAPESEVQEENEGIRYSDHKGFMHVIDEYIHEWANAGHVLEKYGGGPNRVQIFLVRLGPLASNYIMKRAKKSNVKLTRDEQDLFQDSAGAILSVEGGLVEVGSYSPDEESLQVAWSEAKAEIDEGEARADEYTFRL